MTMSQPEWKAVLAAVLCAAAFFQLGLAQAPPTILTVDLENRVQYFYEIADPLKFATDPGVPPHNVATNFHSSITLSDIVAVNGQPTKGIQIIESHFVGLNPNPAPGGAIADITGNFVGLWSWQFLKPDGTLIGTLESKGILTDSTAVTILGGTGAFLGARGTHLVGTTSVPTRSASIAEDPSNRRNRAGGKGQGVIYLIPMERPEIVTTSSGPAVFHSDFTPVTAAKPAKAGELLIVKATGLGPTVPGVDPGRPFPLDAPPQVNSPIAVTVNGQAADVVNSIGWPGLVATYRMDFRMPDGATGRTAAIQLSAAWIARASVNIPIQ